MTHKLGKSHSLGIAMSGGSIKIAYHAGVLKALDERGHLDKVTFLAGSSAGALASAFLACNYVDDLIHILKTLKRRRDVFRFQFFGGLYNLKPVRKLVDEWVDNKPYCEAVAAWVDYKRRDFPIKYTSNRTSHHEKFKNAILDSSTIPVLMKPERIGHFDGGVREFIPLTYTLKRCDRVIAISTGSLSREPTETRKKPWWLPWVCWWLWLTVNEVVTEEIKKGDFAAVSDGVANVAVIAPDKEIDVGMFEINPAKIQAMIDQGYEDGMKADLSAIEGA